MGECDVDWDSKRCEVLGNAEDMSDEEGKTGVWKTLVLKANS